MNPTWQSPDGAIQLWLGDCLAILPQLPDGLISAVVTDPPYHLTRTRRAAAALRRSTWEARMAEHGSGLGTAPARFAFIRLPRPNLGR